MVQLQRVSDGAIFDVLGTKIATGELHPDGSGRKCISGHVVWLQRVGSPHGPFGHGNQTLQDNFTAYPPQERPAKQLANAATGTVYDVLGAKDPGAFPVGEGLTLTRTDGSGHPAGFDVLIEYVRETFTAYPPQETPAPTGQLKYTVFDSIFDVVAVYANAVLLRAVGSNRNTLVSRPYVQEHFTAHPPQEQRPAPTGQLTSDLHRAVFEVVEVGPESIRIQAVDRNTPSVLVARWYVQKHFTAYPPQPKPDRVDQLAEETDGWKPAQAYRITFCPVDDKPLEPGYRVVEAYAGALVDASKCLACGRFFDDDTLIEIKLWEES